jgi:hypothetical protein
VNLPANKLEWTPAELEFLSSAYLRLPSRTVARKLGRSLQAVKHKARRAGLAWRDVGRAVRGRKRRG